MSVILLLVKIIGMVVGAVLAFVVGVIMLISAAIFVVLFLQLLGIVRRVPLGYNIRNLMVRWRITLLTALASTLVVTLMTVLLAFVNGMYRLTESSGVPGNIIVLSDGATDEMFSNLAVGDIDNIATFCPGVQKRTATFDGKTSEHALVSYELYVVVNQPIEGAPKGGRQRRFIQVRGIRDVIASALVHNIELHEGGKWFSAAGAQGSGDSATLTQAVLGEGIARELGQDVGKKTLVVGDTFDLGPLHWVVVGIMKSAGSTFDSEVWTKLDRAGETFGKPKMYTTVMLRTENDAKAKEAAGFLSKEFKTPAVAARTEADYFSSLNETNKTFLYAILFVTIVMAIGGIFGVMNTMFAAIAQRTRDIGVLRILGFSRWQILVSFFLESVLLALIGGLLGIALGSLCHGWSATSIISSGQGGGKSVVLKLVVDARIIAAGLGFAVVMGCIGGLLPALSAVRLKPLDALR